MGFAALNPSYTLEPDLFEREAFLIVIVLLIAASFLPYFRKSQPRSVRFDPDRPYRVYTRDFDVEIKVDDLDALLATLPASNREWAARFSKADPGELYELEKQLASSRAHIEAVQPHDNSTLGAADKIMSLLIDHSGSMRGQPMLLAARAALVASDLLDRLGVKQEVLGFTTVLWKGGRSREKWLSDGKPSYPGRLNDLLHIIYCSAGEKLNAEHCAAMLRLDLLKENFDGEAIKWAASRLRQRKERKKYLIVLSDGAPVDDSTLYSNGGEYMVAHLKRVTREIEQAGDIRLAAIGIGTSYPVEQYYRDGVTISSPEELEGALVQLINRLLHPSL